ncbi:hypothetical protein [Lacinutrix jangbogonensis]|uniref:hypothetical protein n=1 Tax=Lacinutrix jangbogonensis TaxID=1469557 RepID=UPI00053E9A10|nr:hypothetical protein [Lacinutrix jangbogonensis]
MKQLQHYKLFTVLLLLPLVMLANTSNDKDGKHKKEKTITKSFNVNDNATLKVDNSYGNLDIVTWDGNTIDFEITITTTGDNEEKVQKKLDGITVEFSGSQDLVTAITKFSKNKSKSWWSWKNSNTVQMKINYIIKMPITNNVNLSNDYGNINLGTLEGRAELNCDYGKITTKELLADNNNINFDYSNNCYFEFIKSGKINADYSGFTVSKANTLEIIADYTKSKVEVAEDVTYNCDYGGITIDKVNNLKGNGDYLTVIIGDVYKNLDITADYGSIKIEKLQKSVKNVSIDSDYVGIKIGYDPMLAFDFDIALEYGSLKDSDDGFNFVKKRVESSDRYYRGYYSTQNSGSLVKINSEYGSVTFYQN